MAELIPVDHDPFASPPTTANLTPVDHDPFAAAPPPAQGGVLATLTDVAKAGATGLAKGIAHIPSAYGDMRDAASYGGQWLLAHGLDLAGALPKGRTARDLLADFNRPPTPDASPPSFGLFGKLARGLDQPAVNSAQVDEAINSTPAAPYYGYRPQTKAGQYADTIGQFMPMALLSPGSASTNALRFGISPAIASQLAGDATSGTALEPWARGGAAMLAAGVGSARAGPTAEQAALSRAMRGVDDGALPDAQRLMQEARARGINLSSAEAVDHVTGGGSQMGRLQRVLEGTEGGGAVFRPAMAQRPGEVSRAVGDALDRIAPASQTPSVVGLRAQEAAQGALDDVNGQINAASRPFYRAAEARTLAPADFAPIADDSAFQASLRRLRANEVLGPQYAHLPDNAIGVVDAVTKDMRARGEALGSVANPGFQPQEAASYASGAREAREIARDPLRGGSADYDAALALQAQGRQTFLDPLQAGPLGKIAGTQDVRAQAGAMFPAAPLEGAPAESAEAMRRLAQRSPEAAAGLARQHIASSFAEASQNLQGGANQWGGAKFAAAVAGNPIQRQTLLEALGGLPNAPAISPDVQALLRVLEATGRRQQPGSLTAFKARDLRALGEPGPLQAAGEAARSFNIAAFWKSVGEKIARERLETRSQSLARTLLSEPEDAIDALRQARIASPDHRLRMQALVNILSGRSGALSTDP